MEDFLKKYDEMTEQPIQIPETMLNNVTEPESQQKTIPSERFIKSSTKNIKLAADYEDKGFYYLENKEIDDAIKSFRQSENSYNGYHMAYDIANFLEKQKIVNPKMKDTEWKNIYDIILKNYSWRMPEKYKESLKLASSKISPPKNP